MHIRITSTKNYLCDRTLCDKGKLVVQGRPSNISHDPLTRHENNKFRVDTITNRFVIGSHDKNPSITGP